MALSNTGTHPLRDYCVQYRETDFDFVSRLLEEEGIFYFFEHTAEKHTLVIADSPTAIKSGPVPKMSAVSGNAGAYSNEYITSFEMDSAFVSGSVAATDYNFETPLSNLLSRSPTTLKGLDNSQFEVYDHPGKYANRTDGDKITRVLMDEEARGAGRRSLDRPSAPVSPAVPRWKSRIFTGATPTSCTSCSG